MIPFFCMRRGLHYVWKGQNNKYWFLKNLSEVLEVPQHDLKVHVWCAVSVQKIRGFIFLKKVSFDHSIIIQGVVRRRGNVADRHYLYELRSNFWKETSYFKSAALSLVKKYFHMVWCLLRSCRSAPQDWSIK
jgi:hypothetical protein